MIKVDCNTCCPQTSKTQTGRAGVVRNRARTESGASGASKGLARPPGSGRDPATLTPSSGPRPITVSPDARTTGGPPSCGCSSKPLDMAERMRPLDKETVPSFHGHARGLGGSSENYGGGELGARLPSVLLPHKAQGRVPSLASLLVTVTPRGFLQQAASKLLFKSPG